MKGNRYNQIGIDRLVKVDWLEKTASLVLAGNDAGEIKKILQEDLKTGFRSSSADVRGSLDKTITILTLVWQKAPKELEPLRLEGLEFIRTTPRCDHMPIHWGMVMAVYPFWSAVATQAGRLLRLQKTAAAVQIQRRVREQYGERETVSRRVRYVLRSFVDWGVLLETSEKGIYSSGTPISIDNHRTSAWLIEASLRARESGSAPLRDLVENPGLFPFRIKPIKADALVTANSRLDLLRHGLDDDLIMLRRPEK